MPTSTSRHPVCAQFCSGLSGTGTISSTGLLHANPSRNSWLDSKVNTVGRTAQWWRCNSSWSLPVAHVPNPISTNAHATCSCHPSGQSWTCSTYLCSLQQDGLEQKWLFQELCMVMLLHGDDEIGTKACPSVLQGLIEHSGIWWATLWI